MAAPPRLRGLSMESFTDAPQEIQPTLKKVLESLNPFLRDSASALDKRLTARENMAAVYRTVTVTAPAQQWTAPTFSADWVDFGGAQTPTGYRIDESGRVYLRGLIKSGTVGGAAFTLPTGYRPGNQQIFATASNDLYGQVSVGDDGVVTVSVGSNTWVSLDGISFDAAGPAAAPLATVGAGWPIALKAVDDNGRSLGMPVSGVEIRQVLDTSSGAATSHGAHGLHWETSKDGGALVRRIGGLSPGRSYKITFLMTGG